MKRAAIAFLILVTALLTCQTLQFTPAGSGPSQQPATPDLSGYFLPDPTVGLDGLRSYTQTLSVSFNGTQGGNPVYFIDSYQQDLNRETQTQFAHSIITNTDGTQKTITAGNAGDAYYSKLGDEKCSVSWGARAEGIEPFVPARLLPPLFAVYEGDLEEINGVQAQSYTFDAESLGYPSTTTVDGQVWLAQDGGYVVKFTMHIQDEGELFGEGTQGEQVYEYELSQINALSGPELPEGCPAVLTDFPAMPDAVDIQRLPQVLAYTSPSNPSQIQGFYEQELQSQGWTKSSVHSFSKDDTTLVFMHAEDSKITYITLQVAGTDTWVTVKVEPLVDSMPGLMP
jgi:hypothetical protein